jgi:hypothetical protein
MVDRLVVCVRGLALAASALLLARCQLVADVESRQLDPIQPGCSLPSGPGPRVRVANFVPSSGAVDVCIRASGTSWGEPLILDGGSGCAQELPASGFAYSQVSVPFTAPAARVDVKMVAGGGTCNATALTEADGVALAASAVTTLVRIGGNGAPQQLLALPEYTGAQPTDAGLYRVVHAMPRAAPVEFGDASQDHLPTGIATLFESAPIAYGHTAAAGTAGAGGSVESGGYAVVPTAEFNLALATVGTNSALVLVPDVSVVPAVSSFYLTGIAGSDAYPPQGFVCPEDTTPTAGGNALVVQCQPSALPTISVDTFNASLYGPDAPDWQQRRAALAGPSELTQSSADLMCVIEVDEPAEQQSIIATAAGNGFKYAYRIDTNQSTPFTNPRTQTGTIPPAPTTPPCAGSVPASDVNNAIACMEQSCSNAGPGDGTGELTTTTDCLTSSCSGPLGALLIEFPACFDCLIDYVASTQSYGATQQYCTTQATPPLAFQGATPNFILSKYPLAKTDSYILTSTLYRATVLYAQAQFEDGLDVDFYCGQFSSTLDASAEPYDGFYGGDAGTSQGQYDNEQTWQGQQLVDWVKQKSGKNPAIIAGDWHSGVGSATGGTNDAGFPLATPLNPQTLQLLAQTLTPASTPSWAQAPLCNICPCAQNPLQCPGTDSSFVLQPFLYNWPHGAAAVVDEHLAYTDTPLTDFTVGGQVPLSQYYGLNIHVIRPPAAATVGADAGTGTQ